jgi:hypothetical protein
VFRQRDERSDLLLAALENEGVARSFRNELALLWPLLADLMLALSHVCSAGAGLMRASQDLRRGPNMS